jgi:hypothetical protein
VSGRGYPDGKLTQYAVHNVVRQLTASRRTGRARPPPRAATHLCAALSPRQLAPRSPRGAGPRARPRRLGDHQIYLRLAEDDVDAGVYALETGELQLHADRRAA